MYAVSIFQDLKSSNILENCMALTAASQLIGSEMIPALLPMVLDKLKHSRRVLIALDKVFLFFQPKSTEFFLISPWKHTVLVLSEALLMSTSMYVFMEKYEKYQYFMV